MRITSKPKSDGTKRIVEFVLYAKKNDDGTVPSMTVVEEMSDAEWKAFKKLPDSKKKELLHRTAESSDEVILGGAPVLDDKGTTKDEYEHDFDFDENGNPVMKTA